MNSPINAGALALKSYSARCCKRTVRVGCRGNLWVRVAIDAQFREILMEGLKRRRLAFLGQTVAIGLGIAGAARAAEPTKQELLDRINSLQSQLDEVKTQQ